MRKASRRGLRGKNHCARFCRRVAIFGWSSEKIWALGFEWTLTIQARFSDLEYAANKRVTRRDWFLREIDAVMPWSALVAEIGPFYPKVDGRGRPPVGLQQMLRVYLAQQCFGQSGDGIEDTIDDRQAIRGLIGIDLNRKAASDATILFKFRRLLEANNLTERIFTAINTLRAAKDSLKNNAPSCARRSSERLPRRKTDMFSATLRCIKPRRATNGIPV